MKLIYVYIFFSDEVFSGLENSLRLQQIMEMEISCFMNLVAYPFDEQDCEFTFRLTDTPRHLLALYPGPAGVSYTGPESIREYSFRNIVMYKNDKGNYSGQAIKITLANLSSYHVTVSFIPTLVMVLICYFTLYFDLDDFQDRIMVSLTALLVLATLFTQITENTPKTAYLQLLDIWFVSSIFFAFLVVSLLVLINHYRLKEGSDALHETTPVFSLSKQPIEMALQKSEPIVSKSAKINSRAQWLMPVVLGSFLVAYFITAYSTS